MKYSSNILPNVTESTCSNAVITYDGDTKGKKGTVVRPTIIGKVHRGGISSTYTSNPSFNSQRKSAHTHVLIKDVGDNKDEKKKEPITKKSSTVPNARQQKYTSPAGGGAHGGKPRNLQDIPGAVAAIPRVLVGSTLYHESSSSSSSSMEPLHHLNPQDLLQHQEDVDYSLTSSYHSLQNATDDYMATADSDKLIYSFQIQFSVILNEELSESRSIGTKNKFASYFISTDNHTVLTNTGHVDISTASSQDCTVYLADGVYDLRVGVSEEYSPKATVSWLFCNKKGTSYQALSFSIKNGTCVDPVVYSRRFICGLHPITIIELSGQFIVQNITNYVITVAEDATLVTAISECITKEQQDDKYFVSTHIKAYCISYKDQFCPDPNDDVTRFLSVRDKHRRSLYDNDSTDVASFDNTYGIGVVYVVTLNIVDTKHGSDSEAKEAAIDTATKVSANMDNAIADGFLQSEVRASARAHESTVLYMATVSKSFIPLSYISVNIRQSSAIQSPTLSPTPNNHAALPVEEKERAKNDVSVTRHVSHSLQTLLIASTAFVFVGLVFWVSSVFIMKAIISRNSKLNGDGINSSNAKNILNLHSLCRSKKSEPFDEWSEGFGGDLWTGEGARTVPTLANKGKSLQIYPPLASTCTLYDSSPKRTEQSTEQKKARQEKRLRDLSVPWNSTMDRLRSFTQRRLQKSFGHVGTNAPKVERITVNGVSIVKGTKRNVVHDTTPRRNDSDSRLSRWFNMHVVDDNEGSIMVRRITNHH